jgi:tetratricopeptide (TPR) repeat protein
MKILALSLIALTSVPGMAQMAMDHMDHSAKSADGATPERLGTVIFSVSCAASVQAPFNRGVALLHDFWYEEAQRQFNEIAKTDPDCAMAHWGVAMSYFHQIWNRPDENSVARGWAEMQKAQSPAAKTPRERAYVAALSDFYRPGEPAFPERVKTYSEAMGKLYAEYPEDVDAGAFYALSLLAATAPDDTSLTANRKAMAVLAPLFAKYPDNPGLDHYITHACDNPAMAAEGLAGADHYREIAQSGAHAYHMPGHIYARLGMWPQDIEANLGSVNAAKASQAKYGSGIMDEPHSYDFLLYAYLQSGQDDRAKWVLEQTQQLLGQIDTMPAMGGHRMSAMVPYYRSKFAVFYALETRDWKSAAGLEPPAGSPPDVATLAIWARAIAHGHLRQSAEAKADLARYDALMDEIRKGKNSFLAEGTGVKIEQDEVMGWAAFADGKQDEALKHMAAAADLQDKVGQGEVDIPAREMLADMLLESHQPRQALVEYEVALKLSPNRFNALYHAGLAAEQAGEKAKAQQFYAALLKSTDNGAHSARPEFAHLKNFVASTQMAAQQ